MALKKRWGKNKIPMHLLVEEFLKDNVAFKGDLLDILWESRDEFIDWRESDEGSDPGAQLAVAPPRRRKGRSTGAGVWAMTDPCEGRGIF